MWVDNKQEAIHVYVVSSQALRIHPCSNPIMFVFCIMPSSHSMYHCHLDSVSHLDPLNYPLTNANKNTITVEDSSSWCQVVYAGIRMTWYDRCTMPCVCILTPQQEGCWAMQTDAHKFSHTHTRWYYRSYLQTIRIKVYPWINTNDPLFNKLLASAPCPWNIVLLWYLN